MVVLLLLGQLTERGGSKGYAIFCGLHLVWTGRGLECWDGQKLGLVFGSEKERKISPRKFWAQQLIWLSLWARHWLWRSPGALILPRETPKAATCQLSAAPSKERTYCWKSENISRPSEVKMRFWIDFEPQYIWVSKFFLFFLGCLTRLLEARME